MKKELHKDFAALCNPSTVEPNSEFLFGDLSRLTKDISEANKLTKRGFAHNITQAHVVKSTGGRSGYGPSEGNQRFHPYQRGKTSDFLGKGCFSR